MIKIRYFIQANIINKGKQFSNEKVTFSTSSVIKKQSRVAVIKDFSLRGFPFGYYTIQKQEALALYLKRKNFPEK